MKHESKSFIIVIVAILFCSIFSFAFRLHLYTTTPVIEGELEKITLNDMIGMYMAETPIVDEEVAYEQANKRIAQDALLSSKVMLGNPSLQSVNGESMYVFPLEYTEFFDWNRYRSIRGYITVSATDDNEIEYITQIGNDPIDICYLQSKCFGNNLRKHISDNGYDNMCFVSQSTFELNDAGRPYWVWSVYPNSDEWGEFEKKRFIVVDAQNGHIECYSRADAPDWIDIAKLVIP